MHPRAESKSRRILSRRFHVGPILKALLISVAVEIAVLLVTLDALASFVMRHGAGDHRPTPKDLLANIGVAFHLPSTLMTEPLGLLPLAPLVQIALMTYVLSLFFRVRQRARLKQSS